MQENARYRSWVAVLHAEEVFDAGGMVPELAQMCVWLGCHRHELHMECWVGTDRNRRQIDNREFKHS